MFSLGSSILIKDAIFYTLGRPICKLYGWLLMRKPLCSQKNKSKMKYPLKLAMNFACSHILLLLLLTIWTATNALWDVCVLWLVTAVFFYYHNLHIMYTVSFELVVYRSFKFSIFHFPGLKLHDQCQQPFFCTYTVTLVSTHAYEMWDGRYVIFKQKICHFDSQMKLAFLWVQKQQKITCILWS